MNISFGAICPSALVEQRTRGIGAPGITASQRLDISGIGIHAADVIR